MSSSVKASILFDAATAGLIGGKLAGVVNLPWLCVLAPSLAWMAFTVLRVAFILVRNAHRATQEAPQ